VLKADLHIHTEYSMDCQTRLADILRRCQEIGINCIAIADHGTAEGALKMQSLASFRVIVAEEILTPQGEIMGMFLKKTIPSGISLKEAMAEIRNQDGLICVPHPFDGFPRSGLGREVMENIAHDIDIVEVFNARSPLPVYSRQTKDYAARHNLPGGAGSDAHTLEEIGHAYVTMPEFQGSHDFIVSLRQGRVFGQPTTPFIHFKSMWARVRKKQRRSGS
jgi:predicted metal-dependent phosphoesterase TrpH